MGFFALGSLEIPLIPCRSEPAREKRQDNAVTQAARGIVDVHREQARSYKLAFMQFGQTIALAAAGEGSF